MNTVLMLFGLFGYLLCLFACWLFIYGAAELGDRYDGIVIPPFRKRLTNDREPEICVANSRKHTAPTSPSNGHGPERSWIEPFQGESP